MKNNTKPKNTVIDSHVNSNNSTFSNNHHNSKSKGFSENHHNSNLEWKEANKTDPCPICSKTDWCYLGFDGTSLEMAICGRAPVTVDDEWVEFGTTKDDRTKYRREKPEFKCEKTYTPPQTREWVYSDIDGNDKAKQIRWDYEDKEKKIKRQYYVNSQWVWNLPNDINSQEFKDAIAPLYWKEVDKGIGNGDLIFICEGETTTDAVRNLGLTATTFIGGSWSECYKDYFIGANIVLCPDSDSKGIKLMDKIDNSLKDTALSIKWLYAYPESDYLWESAAKRNSGGLDLKDYLQQHPMDGNELKEKIEERRRWLEGQFNKRDRQETKNDGGGKRKKNKSPRCGQIANRLLEKYRNLIAWDISIQQWRRYGAEHDGIWNKEADEFIRQVLYAELEAMEDVTEEDITPALVKQTEELLKWKLAIRKWDSENRSILPMLNGVLDLKTRELHDHSPNNRLTWVLPINFDPKADCDPIKEWLLEMCGGDRTLMDLMRVWLYGVLAGRTDWQKYLELIGPGGTGKSTFIRLAIALVGQENVHTTTLHKLEGSRFETACIKDKRLVVITDSERYSGNVSTLKAMTGQDTIPYEVKMKQSMGGFVPRAMVIVAANEIIQSGDYTSGLERRRVTIPFSNKIPASKQRNLIEINGDGIEGEFTPYLTGLLNWVLEVDPTKATAMVKDYVNAVPKLGLAKARSLTATNPIADWLDCNILYRPEERTQIGVAKRDKRPDSLNQYQNVDRWLYANYCEFCSETQSKPIGLRRFVNLLSDLCSNQLGLDGVKRDRDQHGRYFVGLTIRDDTDIDPPLVTGKIKPSMTDDDGTMTDKMTDEPPMDAKLCWNDGSNQSKIEIKDKRETRNVTETTKPDPETNNGDNPALQHNPASTGNPAVSDSSSVPSSSPSSEDKTISVEVGDNIIHWSWDGVKETSTVKEIEIMEVKTHPLSNDKKTIQWIDLQDGSSLSSDSDHLIAVTDQWGKVKWER